MSKLLITGTSGFVGSRFMDLYPKKKEILPVSLQTTAVKDIDFSGVDTVLHCAGIAHRMEGEDEGLYFSVNRDLTLELAKAAKANGVKQFLFLSTIKVYGLDQSESPITVHSSPFTPNDPYGQSKLEAEEGLRSLEGPDFIVTILRPPLIYGPGAKGNLLKLMQGIAGSSPLPLGGIDNRRSMVFVDNLVHLLDQLIQKGEAITVVPADQPAISTTQLVNHLKSNINPKKKIIAIPVFMRTLLKWIKPGFHQRLFGSLEVAESASYQSMGLEQKYSVEEGLKAMAEAFIAPVK